MLALVDGTAIPRARLPVSPYRVGYGVQTRFGIGSLHALPPVLCSAEALMCLVGVKARPVRQGLCQRGATTRHVRALEAVFQGSLRAWANTGVCGAQGTGMAAGTDLETTERATGGGQVTRQGRMAETRGRGHERAVTVDGGTVRLLRAAVPTMPLAVQVVPIQAPESRSWRALVTQARTNLAGHARLH